jgi:hypothetical protein
MPARRIGVTSIADLSVTTAKLADASVTATKVAADVATQDELDLETKLGTITGVIDAVDYGMKADTVRSTNGSITSGSNVLTGTFAASNAAVGKLVTVLGAGAVVASGSDGSMSQAVGRDKNVLSRDGYSF